MVRAMTGLQPFDPMALLLIALLNPAVIAVALLMGRASDQPQKVLVAGFAAACAGAVLVWVAAWLRVLPARGVGGEAGLFVLQFVVGIVWAAIGYRWLRPARGGD
ncbi:MAG: hypothetical protein AB7O43_22515 [Hyphomicrobiaceae bacterium]